MDNMRVRIFLGLANADKGNIQNYPVGERHAFILYMLQEVDEEPNWQAAEDFLAKSHWSNIELTKTGLIPDGGPKNKSKPFPEMYENAINKGQSLLIYSDPVNANS